VFFTQSTFIGIDPTAGQRPFAYAALDSELRLLALGQGSLEEVLAFSAGQRQALTGVCAPRQPNLALLAREEVRASMNPPPRPGRWVGFRLAEYSLRQHNISTPRTPGREEDCPNWMRMGFSLHRRLGQLGYRPLVTGNGELNEGELSRRCLEVYPHASFTVLLGKAPLPKHSLEGRLQRQLILHELKLKIPDPMRIFEEFTRHKLLKGILPLEDLYSPAELDALVAAYTAWLSAAHPEQITCVGDPEEGQVVLPVSELKANY
jgi:hypothetical protein